MKSYWLCTGDDEDCDVVAGPFDSWEKLVGSEACTEAFGAHLEGGVAHVFYLIVRPGLCPMIGGFYLNQQDPS